MIKHIAVAYYPEQCGPAKWKLDIGLMKSHGIDAVRILEFAWSRIERDDEKWDFDWIHRFMKLLLEHEMKAILCTPSASPPIWLTECYPECLMVDANGQRACPGARRHYCPSSPIYRKYAVRIALKMFTELGAYPNVIAWQIDNELGFNRCYCCNCEELFRNKVKQKYETLDKLNEAWGNAFWSLDIWKWEHVKLPRNANSSPAIIQEYCQFYSDIMVDFFDEQALALKNAGCSTPISTNLMGNFDQIDYWELAKRVDFIGFDNYFDFVTLAGNGLCHDLMRSLKNGMPYWTFETQVDSCGHFRATPSGFNVVYALANAMRGEEVHTFFRWDSCCFGHEQDIQGLVDYGGIPRSKLFEVKEIRRIADLFTKIKLPSIRSEVACIFSYQNYWGANLYYDGGYWKEVNRFYEAIFSLGLTCDFVKVGADLNSYKVILAPGFCMVDESELNWLRRYVENGGILVAGRKTFSKNLNNSYISGLHPALNDVFGIRIIQSQNDLNTADLFTSLLNNDSPRVSYSLISSKGFTQTKTTGWFEVLKLDGADSVYDYAEGEFKGQCAASIASYGKGVALYLGVCIEPIAMKELIKWIFTRGNVKWIVDVPQGAQIVRRGNIALLTNHSSEGVYIDLKAKIVMGEKSTLDRGKIYIEPYGWCLTDN